MVSLDNIWNAIEKFGYENVVQVVTNNAIVCKKCQPHHREQIS
jgi:hypothetical protein